MQQPDRAIASHLFLSFRSTTATPLMPARDAKGFLYESLVFF
jgi:hypothetical protein